MHSADYAVARCPSVCPSVTRRYSVEMAKRILNFFTVAGSHTILFFSAVTKRYGNTLTGTPLTWASNAACRAGIKNAIFEQYLALSRKRYDTKP